MNEGWGVRQTAYTEDKHVVPVGDLIDHVPDDCPCGSRDELWADEKGIEFWIVTHNSLDGRELSDPGYLVPQGAKSIWSSDE